MTNKPFDIDLIFQNAVSDREELDRLNYSTYIHPILLNNYL